MHHLWLEFDLPRAGGDYCGQGPPVPGLFICFGETRPPVFSARRWLSMVRDALPRATGVDLPRTWNRALACCFDRLPDSAYVPYVGMMRQRPDAGIRLCITGLSDPEIVELVVELGWPGSGTALRDLLFELRDVRSDAPLPGVSMLHIDLRDRIAPAIGLEYSFSRKAQLGGRLCETRFLDHLIAQGLCSATQVDALGPWPGGMTIRLRHEQGFVLRRVNHIKLVYSPECPLQVKAYLCAGFGRLDCDEVTVEHHSPGEFFE